jgi:tetratricopeptide (TPR) repeat protein
VIICAFLQANSLRGEETVLTFLQLGVLAAVLSATMLSSAIAHTVRGAGASGHSQNMLTLAATNRPHFLSRIQDQAKQAAALFESGQQAHQKGDLDKAIELYTQALKRDPELWQAEFQRGAAYFSQNKLNEAKSSLLRVVEQLKAFADAPELRQINARVQTTLGEIALAAAKPDEAEPAFRRALTLNPQAARAHAGLAELLLANNKPAEAIAAAQAALAAGDDRAATFALLGVAQSLTGKHDDALPNLNEALKREPKNAPALLYRAEAFIAKNRLNDAIADLRAALTIEPTLRTRLRLAAALAQTKQFDEANKLYQEVLQEDPANTEARAALAAAMIEAGKGSEAIAQLESLIKAESNRAPLRAQLAELYLPTQPEKALAEYEVAAKLEPNQPGHQIGIGSALVKLRRFQEAVTLLRPLVAQNLKDDVAYFAHTNLATALFELDDFPNAAREFVWVLNYQSQRGDQRRTAITLYFLGICFDKLGDYEQALKAYEQFLALATATNQLEIDKVKLRLPVLQRQLKEGKGKRKP